MIEIQYKDLGFSARSPDPYECGASYFVLEQDGAGSAHGFGISKGQMRGRQTAQAADAYRMWITFYNTIPRRPLDHGSGSGKARGHGSD